MSFLKSVSKSFGWLLAHAVEGTITCICAFASLASLFIAETTLMKLVGFVGFFVIALVAGYGLGRLRGEDKSTSKLK
ncbi:hypothetical protein PMPD1_2882 [Paramixta manurensis]|uniref:Uncharacterized protein n=1 Tax=Paramixta manurensis TaxID=2740817 RepID=A0A6M8UDI1_9GAMM|nr:hypothetical protein PMPD1_2882 [Erwiniaceae bacterium PD-1]